MHAGDARSARLGRVAGLGLLGRRDGGAVIGQQGLEFRAENLPDYIAFAGEAVLS